MKGNRGRPKKKVKTVKNPFNLGLSKRKFVKNSLGTGNRKLKYYKQHLERELLTPILES